MQFFEFRSQNVDQQARRMQTFCLRLVGYHPLNPDNHIVEGNGNNDPQNRQPQQVLQFDFHFQDVQLPPLPRQENLPNRLKSCCNKLIVIFRDICCCLLIIVCIIFYFQEASDSAILPKYNPGTVPELVSQNRNSIFGFLLDIVAKTNEFVIKSYLAMRQFIFGSA